MEQMQKKLKSWMLKIHTYIYIYIDKYALVKSTDQQLRFSSPEIRSLDALAVTMERHPDNLN